MKNNWWNDRVFYEIYIQSFKDGNGDGVGDFKGLTEKLDYLKDLGIKGIWLTPFYPSPKKDNGYDIKDYLNIDPLYGTMDDFENFIKEAHKRDIKVIQDLVLNHTSTEHEWFKESKSSKSNPKRDYYIWKEKDEINNWESFFGNSAWEYNEETKDYYYHAFCIEQADLNWNNEEVRKEMYKIIDYWASKNIDGFRLDVINFLKVNNEFKDNTFKDKEQIHTNDKDQAGILDTIKEIVCKIKNHGDLFVVGEVGSDDLNVLKNYVGYDLLDVVFNFNLGSIDKFDLQKIYDNLNDMNDMYKDNIQETIFFNSHDMGRSLSRFSNSLIPEKNLAKLMATLVCTAKGVPFMYYGEELGILNYEAKKYEQILDVQAKYSYLKSIKEGFSKEDALKLSSQKNRDKSRTPMQWDDTINFGFTNADPWIGFPEQSANVNVKNSLKDRDSTLNFYKNILNIRNNENCLKRGKYKNLTKIGDVLSFERCIDDECIKVFLNYSNCESLTYDSENYDLLISSVENNDNTIIKAYEAKVLKRRK